MVKWIALFIALVVLFGAASEDKVNARFDRVDARIDRMEGKRCTLMQVLTPSGPTTICAIQ